MREVSIRKGTGAGNGGGTDRAAPRAASWGGNGERKERGEERGETFSSRHRGQWRRGGRARGTLNKSAQGQANGPRLLGFSDVSETF